MPAPSGNFTCALRIPFACGRPGLREKPSARYVAEAASRSRTATGMWSRPIATGADAGP